MPSNRMHEHEVETSISLVRLLLVSQFPEWADLDINPVASAGTDNAIYQLGRDKSVRLPRIDWATDQIDKETIWMPRFAQHLPVRVPTPFAKGDPSEGYPYHWGVYEWLEGKNLTFEQLVNPGQAARAVVAFIKSLQQLDITGGPLATEHGLRGVPLKTRDESTREAIQSLGTMIDAKKALKVWEQALEVSDWQGDPVWFHGDLLVGNVLFDRDRLGAVIDFGGLGVGDPAPDLMIAWSLFSGQSRDIFRETLGVDEETWWRGRGQALAQAVMFIPYYLDTNPIGVAHARRMLGEVLNAPLS